MSIAKILVDARNFDDLAPLIIGKMKAASLVGFDIETEDSRRHEGLAAFMKADAEGRKSKARPLVFDVRRTVVCGFSLYIDDDSVAYYVNLAHADVENRVPWHKAKTLLDALNPAGYFVCHLAPFELTMMGCSLGYELPRVIDTLQMSVSAFGPDEYEQEDFAGLPLGAIGDLLGMAGKAFRTFERGKQMTPDQAEYFSKVCGKESEAAHSYNGWIDQIRRPYDLKRAVKYWFGYQMQTFEETLDGEVHMGKLTGEQVVDYGADDSYWAVRLYHRVLKYMIDTNPKVVKTFFEQELPMIHFYSDVWRKGLRVNLDAVNLQRRKERGQFAAVLRNLRRAVRTLLPFPAEPHEGLLKYDGKLFYDKSGEKNRKRIADWAALPDLEDDFAECYRVRGAIPVAWAADEGKPENKLGLNLTYYQIARVLLFDLTREKCLIYRGKVESDADGRGKLKDRIEGRLKDPAQTITQEDIDRLKAAIDVIECLTEMAGVEQRAKLYLNPYQQLIDPETGRVYPVISSKLASRRMAMQYPNGMQLAKKGTSTYVRGFYEPDYPDHVLLSEDWSAIELVAIGDQSGDPEFRKAYGQLPYADLHLGAAASCLSVLWGEDVAKALGMSDPVEAMEAALKMLKTSSAEDIQQIHPKLLINLRGETMKPPSALKFWRGTDCGKGANFNYWYSSALSTVGERLGWTSDQMWAATEKYRERFAVAEQWRVDTIRECQENGFVELPDGHRRYRFEATPLWSTLFGNKFRAYQDDGIGTFANECMRAIRTRAGNQAVNSKIQGLCAAMAKRSILRLRAAIKARGWTDREARVLVPIHDEIVSSVHRDLVVEMMDMQREAMCVNDIIKTLPLTVAPAIGLTFEPFTKEKARRCQIELEELSEVDCISADRWGQKATDDEVREIVNWMFANNNEMRRAA